MAGVVWAALLMMLAGGGIAYLGDWIGLKMGKKRLTLFGLRPRDTAKVFTVAAGASIAIVTFLVLLALNRGFSIALEQGATILHRNHELRSANHTLTQQVTTARSAAAQAQVAAGAAAQKMYVEQARAAAARQSLVKAQTELASVTGTLESARVKLALAQKRGAVLEASNAQLAERNVAIRKSAIRFLNDVVQPQMVAKLSNPLVYRNGAEIGRTVISANQPLPLIRSEIETFLMQLSADALEHGAIRGSNGHAVAIGPFGSESDNIEALAGQIHNFDNGSGSVVVIATAIGNEFAGEQARVALFPHPNRLAIRQGVILGELTVPASEQDNAGAILTDLQRLLVQRIHPAAIRSGVIPVVNPQEHEAQLGDVTVADLYQVVDDVRASHGDAVVTVTAARDTYSADQLALAFSVRSAATTIAGP